MYIFGRIFRNGEPMDLAYYDEFQLDPGDEFTLVTDEWRDYRAESPVNILTTGLVLESYPTQIQIKSIDGFYKEIKNENV